MSPKKPPHFYYFWRSWVSVGIEYISGKNKSYFEYRGPFPFNLPTDNIQNYIISPRFKIMPLKLGTYHTLPLHSRINLFFNTGIIYYFSNFLLYKVHWSSGFGPEFIIYTKEEKYDVSANGLGFYGGIGFEYNIANNLALVLEVQGRYARVNPKGERTSSWWEEPWIKEEGYLYIGERNLMNEGYGKYCPDLIISKSRSSGDEFQNIRKAVLDLSGIALRVGIRIKLF